MAKSVLNPIVKFYEKCVNEVDEAGFAEVFKQSTELLFRRLCKELDMELHFEDVSYGDGYFIFGYGTNSVVHFHIKEAPGWLGGIWWGPITTEETKDKKKKEYKTDCISCALFFQFEKEIDKFKPTASTFGGDYFDFHFDDGYYSSAWFNVCGDLKFIIKEPYLAFYREMHYANFNHEYVSRESAKRYWNRHWKEKAKKEKIKLINAAEFMNMVKYIIKPMVEDGDAFILDRGNCISPRYEIFIKNINLSDGKPMVEEPGCYGLFSFDWDDIKEDKKLWKKTEKACAKREGYKYYFNQPCHDSALIIEPARFNKILKESIADGSAWFYKQKDGTLFEGKVKSE